MGHFEEDHQSSPSSSCPSVSCYLGPTVVILRIPGLFDCQNERLPLPFPSLVYKVELAIFRSAALTSLLPHSLRARGKVGVFRYASRTASFKTPKSSSVASAGLREREREKEVAHLQQRGPLFFPRPVRPLFGSVRSSSLWLINRARGAPPPSLPRSLPPSLALSLDS